MVSFALSQDEEARYLHIINGELFGVYFYFNGFKLRGNRNPADDGSNCVTAFLGLQLLTFKIPGLHGQPIDESNGYLYADDDDERCEYPPVIMTLGTGGRIEAGFVINEGWKEKNLLTDLVPIP